MKLEPLTEKEIGDLVYEVFYGGPLAGSKERIAAAIWKRVEEHTSLLSPSPPQAGVDREGVKNLVLEKLYGRCEAQARFDAAAEITDALFALALLPPRGEVEPNEPGQFEGDIWFGDPANSTRGTHRWASGQWTVLPTDLEVTLGLLATARQQRDEMRDALSDLLDACDTPVTDPDWAWQERQNARAALRTKDQGEQGA